jgi:hypothetical protein
MKQKKITFLSIGFAALALMIMGGVGFYFLGESQETITQTARGQLNALKRGNISKAYYLYTSDNYQEKNSLEQFRKWVNDHPILTNNDTAKFFDENILSDYAILSGELRNSQGNSVPLIYKMINEYGDWKIDSLQAINNEKPQDAEEKTATLQTINEESPQNAKQKTDTLQTINEKAPQAAVEESEAVSHINKNDSIVQVVQNYLIDLKHNRINQAYNDYLADEFKNSVSYDNFNAIIAENSELTEFDSIRIEEIAEDEELKKINISLVSDIDTQDIQFWLAGNEGDWKIWAIEVTDFDEEDFYEIAENTENLKQNAPLDRPEQNGNGAVHTVKDQLQDLKQGNISTAYNNYVSQEFATSTTDKDFETFIHNYPEFTEFKTITIKDQAETDGLTHIQLLLATDKGDSKIDYWLAKQEGEWKVMGIRVEESAYYPPIKEDEREEIIEVVKGQLDALREGDIPKAYYAYASIDFQKNTSLKDFEAFLEDYPILTEQKESTVGHGTEEGELRLLRIALESEDETVEADYRLIKEDGDWKVWGIQILLNPQETRRNEDEIKNIINSQIEAFKSNELSKAYYALSSKKFMKAASFDSFKTYVANHDELRHNKKTVIKDIKFKPAYASAVVNLQGPSRNEQTYLYRLAIENNQWKILSIKLASNSNEVRKHHNPLEITNIVMGTETDLGGLVTNPKQVFSPEEREITVNVGIEKGAEGDEVEAVLEHVKSDSSIPAVSAELDANGASVVIYEFTAPAQGWPTGLYRLHISTSTGASETVEFTVKKHENNSRKPKESENNNS